MANIAVNLGVMCTQNMVGVTCMGNFEAAKIPFSLDTKNAVCESTSCWSSYSCCTV